ncbi:hypothetical protein ZWY2020_026942 [Hordeum vulgare]|nr:hypothetical protein ZWY2020_026942 [Hordeum vulgare]
MPPPPPRHRAGDPNPNPTPATSHSGMVKLLADLLHHTPPSAWPPALAAPLLRSRLAPAHVSSLLLLPASLSRPDLSRRFLLLLPPHLVSPLCLSLLALSFISASATAPASPSRCRSPSPSPHAASLLLSLASSSPSASTSFSSLSHASSLSPFPPAATAAASLLASSYLRLRRAHCCRRLHLSLSASITPNQYSFPRIVFPCQDSSVHPCPCPVR